MKGKQALTAARREVSRLEGDVVVLTLQLAERKDDVASLRRKIVEQGVAEAEIQRLRAQVEDGSADTLAELRTKHDSLLANVGAWRAWLTSIRKQHEKVMLSAVTALGGGSRAMGILLNLLREDGEGFIRVSDALNHDLPLRDLMLLQRKISPNHNRKRLSKTLDDLRDRGLLSAEFEEHLQKDKELGL